MNFDFDAHFRVVQEMVHQPNEMGPQLDIFLRDGAPLARGDRPAALRDLYWNAVVKWERSEWCDFLGRTWRLMESGLETAVGEVTGIDFDGSKASDHAIRKYAEDTPGLMDYLRGRQLEPKASTVVMERILEFLLDRAPDTLSTDQQARFRRLLEVMPVLGRARQLRNQSIIAHGFRGLDKQAILDAVRTDEAGLLTVLRDLVAGFGVDVGGLNTPPAIAPPGPPSTTRKSKTPTNTRREARMAHPRRFRSILMPRQAYHHRARGPRGCYVLARDGCVK